MEEEAIIEARVRYRTKLIIGLVFLAYLLIIWELFTLMTDSGRTLAQTLSDNSVVRAPEKDPFAY